MVLGWFCTGTELFLGWFWVGFKAGFGLVLGLLLSMVLGWFWVWSGLCLGLVLGWVEASFWAWFLGLVSGDRSGLGMGGV